MRAVLLILLLGPAVVACTSENVAPLIEFGPMSAWISAELGPLAADDGREDVNPRIFVSLSHNNPDCPVFGSDVNASIDGVHPDSFERGYYSEGSSYGHDDSASCQPPFFSINRVPTAKPTSVLRISDSTADLSLEVDRLFVNPAMSIATPLVRGQLARIDVADDRQITMVEGVWWIDQGEESFLGYDVMATVTPNGISFRMPTEVSGFGRLDIRLELAAPQLTCIGFSECSVTIKGSQTFNATLQ